MVIVQPLAVFIFGMADATNKPSPATVCGDGPSMAGPLRHSERPYLDGSSGVPWTYA